MKNSKLGYIITILVNALIAVAFLIYISAVLAISFWSALGIIFAFAVATSNLENILEIMYKILVNKQDKKE